MEAGMNFVVRRDCTTGDDDAPREASGTVPWCKARPGLGLPVEAGPLEGGAGGALHLPHSRP
jgi:hypothetical protein